MFQLTEDCVMLSLPNYVLAEESRLAGENGAVGVSSNPSAPEVRSEGVEILWNVDETSLMRTLSTSYMGASDMDADEMMSFDLYMRDLPPAGIVSIHLPETEIKAGEFNAIDCVIVLHKGYEKEQVVFPTNFYDPIRCAQSDNLREHLVDYTEQAYSVVVAKIPSSILLGCPTHFSSSYLSTWPPPVPRPVPTTPNKWQPPMSPRPGGFGNPSVYRGPPDPSPAYGGYPLLIPL
ncbi:unnamed protein product [Angiostrongylus costaricensis]|uniref:PITH domain-containing protein n=1 Tax=Angiostrongylus costaricensis TaxID=334426 RepID=A0A0R3PZB4_ANGCS|nr:unnamed protein product [Angiostrongylus costaricensis]